MNQIKKDNVYAQEAGAKISQIKELIEKIKFEVKLKLVRGHEDPTGQHNIQLLKYLIKECGIKSRETAVNIRNFERANNMKYYGNYALMHKGNVVSRAVQETMQVIDGNRAEQEYGKKKIGCGCDFVDAEARNVFNSKVATPPMIKCAHGFNHFGLRDSMIKDNMVEAHCLRCERVETWDHVVKCSETIDIRKVFVEKLLLEILKNKDEVEANLIMSFFKDILRCLEDGTKEDCETNQYHVGMKELFRGYAALD